MHMPHVKPGHQYRARRSTNGAAGVEVAKLHPFGSHLIEARRLNFLLTVTTKITIPEIVRHDENNIGSRLIRIGLAQARRNVAHQSDQTD